MSVVSGIVLCASCVEENGSDGEDGLPLWCGTINAWLAGKNERWGKLRMVEYHFGGTKHPQTRVAGAGFNHFDEEAFAEFVLSQPWECPENVVLIIQPEDGPTRVFRPAPHDRS